jgi:hypothetical protein
MMRPHQIFIVDTLIAALHLPATHPHRAVARVAVNPATTRNAAGRRVLETRGASKRRPAQILPVLWQLGSPGTESAVDLRRG